MYLDKVIIQCYFLQATLITLGVQVYEILRPKFPHIVEIIQRIPNTNLADIQKLDEKISMNSQTKGNKIDKYKKDLFKKITAQVTSNSIPYDKQNFNKTLFTNRFRWLQLIGKNIGQLFRKEAIIANLRPITTTSVNPSFTSLLDSSNQETNIVSQLFSTNS